MKRFENAQIDDLVWCRKYGNGVIDTIENGESVYKIEVVFEGEKGNPLFEAYTIGGYIDEDDAEPMLFYRKGEEKYLTERPEPEIDWENVKQGTMFFVGVCECPNMPERPFHIFDGTIPWFRHSFPKDHLYSWKIIKPVNPLEIPYK